MSAADESEIKYGTMVTPAGKAVIAAAIADNAKVDIASVAIGDGGGEAYIVQAGQEDIRNQVYEGKPNAVYVDPNHPNYVVVELYVPETVGGWTIREVAVKTASGAVLAVGCVPAVYKPVMEQGSSIGGLYRFILKIADASVINLIVDPSTVMATINYVDGQITLIRVDIDNHIEDMQPHGGTYGKTPERLMWRNEEGRCQVADPKDPADATPMEWVEGIIDEKISKHRINTEAPLTGGGTLNKDLNLGIDDATIDARGVAELATIEETLEGKDDSRIVTPAGLAKYGETIFDQIEVLRRLTLIFGEIRLLPFRHDTLPFGWYFCNGERFPDTSDIGKALMALPQSLRNDWGVTTTGAGTNLPLLLDSGGKGFFFRGVDGVSRMPGSIEGDAARAISATAKSTATSSGRITGSATPFVGTNGGYFPNPTASGAFSYTQNGVGHYGDGVHDAQNYGTLSISAAIPTPTVTTEITVTQDNIDTENRPTNIGMTPAIFLGV